MELTRAYPDIAFGAVLPRMAFDREGPALRQALEAACRAGVTQALLGHVGQLALARAFGLTPRGDFGLGFTNTLTGEELARLGFASATASFECRLSQIRDLGKALPTEAIVYGRLPLMLMEHCILKNRGQGCHCEEAPQALQDRKGEAFPVEPPLGLPQRAFQRQDPLAGGQGRLEDRRPDLRPPGLPPGDPGGLRPGVPGLPHRGGGGPSGVHPGAVLPGGGVKPPIGRDPLSSVGGSVGTVAGWTLQRGFPADDRGAARLSLKKVGGKNTRGKPLDPIFIAARSHSLVFGLVTSEYVRGAIPSGYVKTDLGRIFEGKYAGKHFDRPRNSPHHSAVQKPSPRGKVPQCAHWGG